MDFSNGVSSGAGAAMLDSDHSATPPAAAVPVTIAPASAAMPITSHTVMAWRFPVAVDRDRDALLTDFGRETLKDR